MSIRRVSRRLERQVEVRESARKARSAAVAKVYRCRHAAQTLGAFVAKLAASLAAETQALVEERELLEQRENRLQGWKWIVEQGYEEATRKRQAVAEALRQAKVARTNYDVAARMCAVRTKPARSRR